MHCARTREQRRRRPSAAPARSGRPPPGAHSPGAHLADAVGRLQPGALVAGARAVSPLLRDHRRPPLGPRRLEAEARVGPSRAPRRVPHCRLPGGGPGGREGRGGPRGACETFRCPIGDGGGSDGQQPRPTRERRRWLRAPRPRPPTRGVLGECGRPWQPPGPTPSWAAGRAVRVRGRPGSAPRSSGKGRSNAERGLANRSRPGRSLPLQPPRWPRAGSCRPRATGTLRGACPQMCTWRV